MLNSYWKYLLTSNGIKRGSNSFYICFSPEEVVDGGEDQPAEGEPPDEDEHEGVDVGRRDNLVHGAYLWEGSRQKL